MKFLYVTFQMKGHIEFFDEVSLQDFMFLKLQFVEKIGSFYLSMRNIS